MCDARPGWQTTPARGRRDELPRALCDGAGGRLM